MLRNLLDDGQMVLGDGRRIVSSASSKAIKEECIVIHRNFRMIVLEVRIYLMYMLIYLSYANIFLNNLL